MDKRNEDLLHEASSELLDEEDYVIKQLFKDAIRGLQYAKAQLAEAHNRMHDLENMPRELLVKEAHSRGCSGAPRSSRL